MTAPLTPEILLSAYAGGIFPMAEHRDDPDVFWVDPHFRGVFPLSNFHISRSLAKTIRSERFQITLNGDFSGVVTGCAERDETWINDMLFDLYGQLHRSGRAHSLEVWHDNALVGGVFGITLAGAFFGESMFSRTRDASKVALAYLIDLLRETGFTLFDTQFITPHLASLGAVEIPRATYRQQLSQALLLDVELPKEAKFPDAYSLLQRNAQTS